VKDIVWLMYFAQELLIRSESDVQATPSREHILHKTLALS